MKQEGLRSTVCLTSVGPALCLPSVLVTRDSQACSCGYRRDCLQYFQLRWSHTPRDHESNVAVGAGRPAEFHVKKASLRSMVGLTSVGPALCFPSACWEDPDKKRQSGTCLADTDEDFYSFIDCFGGHRLEVGAGRPIKPKVRQGLPQSSVITLIGPALRLPSYSYYTVNYFQQCGQQ